MIKFNVKKKFGVTGISTELSLFLLFLVLFLVSNSGSSSPCSVLKGGIVERKVKQLNNNIRIMESNLSDGHLG